MPQASGLQGDEGDRNASWQMPCGYQRALRVLNVSRDLKPVSQAGLASLGHHEPSSGTGGTGLPSGRIRAPRRATDCGLIALDKTGLGGGTRPLGRLGHFQRTGELLREGPELGPRSRPRWQHRTRRPAATGWGCHPRRPCVSWGTEAHAWLRTAF